jgi:hypothetical protein
MHERRFRCPNGDQWEVRWWSVPTSTGYQEVYLLNRNGEEVGRETHRRSVLGDLLAYESIGIDHVPPE